MRKPPRYISITTALFISLLTIQSIRAQNWPAGIHDPSSIVKCNDNYWIFGTGDGIISLYSSDMVAWTNGPTPFTKTDFPAWILNYAVTSTDQFEGFFWAPDIIYMNDRYYLYYSCSVWGTMNSCIGVVVNKTLDPSDPEFEWVDQGDIGIYSSGGTVNAIDPAVMRGHDGRIWMTYGSFNRDGIMVTEIDSVSGKPFGTRTSIANSYTGGGYYSEGEGSCMIYRDGYYYLFYNKGGCCNGIASSYYIVMGRSTSPTGPFVDKNGKNMRIIGSTSGGTVVLRHDDSRGLEDRYYGPGHLSLFREKGVDYLSFHYYNPNGYYPSAEANYKGRPTLGLAKVEWDEDGWPAISFDFLDEGIYSMTNTNSGKVMDVYSHTVRSGAELFQYARDTALDSQKWLFTSLGTGEYTIRNYADPNQYIEIPGDGTSEYLEITSDYVGGINQKFRVVEDISGKFMIYPSIRDEIMEIPFAYTNDYRIRLFDNTNHDCQRWYPAMFEETFSVSDDRLIIEYDESENYEIEISSNGSWTVQVADTSWLKTTPGYGTGNSLLGILSEKNPNSEIRTNIITLKSNGGQEFELYVYQKANETGVQENNVSPVFLYPNPCDGIIRIQGNSIMDISVANINGLELFKQSGYVPGESLDFSGLHTGIYIVRITTPNGSKSLRLLKH